MKKRSMGQIEHIAVGTARRICLVIGFTLMARLPE